MPGNGAGPPKKVKAPAPPGADTTSTAPEHSSAADTVTGLHRRRAAAFRLPVLECGCCSDPHTNRHRSGPRPRGYVAAARHLAECGLSAHPDVDELRHMWRCGGRDRGLAETIAECWGLAG